jgi:hypothetical protein
MQNVRLVHEIAANSLLTPPRLGLWEIDQVGGDETFAVAAEGIAVEAKFGVAAEATTTPPTVVPSMARAVARTRNNANSGVAIPLADLFGWWRPESLVQGRIGPSNAWDPMELVVLCMTFPFWLSNMVKAAEMWSGNGAPMRDDDIDPTIPASLGHAGEIPSGIS